MGRPNGLWGGLGRPKGPWGGLPPQGRPLVTHVMELAASLPKDMRDDIGEYVDSLDFNAMKISESCICMTYDD